MCVSTQELRDHVDAVLTIFPIEAHFPLVLLLALQGFVHLLDYTLAGFRSVEEAAGTGFLHHLIPNEAGQLTKPVWAVHDGVAVTTLSITQEEVTVCEGILKKERLEVKLLCDLEKWWNNRGIFCGFQSSSESETFRRGDHVRWLTFLFPYLSRFDLFVEALKQKTIVVFFFSLYEIFYLLSAHWPWNSLVYFRGGFEVSCWCAWSL